MDLFLDTYMSITIRGWWGHWNDFHDFMYGYAHYIHFWGRILISIIGKNVVGYTEHGYSRSYIEYGMVDRESVCVFGVND